MPAKLPVIIGTRYARLTVIRDVGFIKKFTMIEVRCDCGVVSIVRYASLKNGSTTSCGRCSHMTHGHAGLLQVGTLKGKTYRVWRGVLRRCRNPSETGYSNYGGRGISVCERWDMFANFLADMGEIPSDRHSIERIDVNGNYEPSNCKWALPDEQARNRRTSRRIEYNGTAKTIADWAREFGIGERTIWMRLSYGWTVERALTTKSQRKNPALPPKPVI